MARETAAQISNKYSEYIAKLPGVINANVVFSNGEIEEVHVLADTSRAPKQIVRDIQSLFMAQFQTEVDHRVISIAQIECELAPAAEQNARFIIEGVTVAKRRESSQVEITLSLGGRTFVGKQSSLKDNYDVFRGIAQATLDAIALSEDCRRTYSVLDVKFAEIAGERTAIVCVSLGTPGNVTCRFSGTAFSQGEDSLSIVKATLDALNRRIGYGLTP